MESDGDDDSETEMDTSSRILVTPSRSIYSISVPLLADCIRDEKIRHLGSASAFQEASDQEPLDTTESLESELSFIRMAKNSGVVYLFGHGDIRARKDSWFIKKLIINYFYAFLRRNCRRGIATLSIPHTNLIHVGMQYMV